jgi:hypothetical protein
MAKNDRRAPHVHGSADARNRPVGLAHRDSPEGDRYKLIPALKTENYQRTRDMRNPILSEMFIGSRSRVQAVLPGMGVANSGDEATRAVRLFLVKVSFSPNAADNLSRFPQVMPVGFPSSLPFVFTSVDGHIHLLSQSFNVTCKMLLRGGLRRFHQRSEQFDLSHNQSVWQIMTC